MRGSVLAAMTLASCTAAPDAEQANAAYQAIVYGTDDRRDVFEVDDQLAELVARRSVALIASEHLEAAGNDRYRVKGPRYGELQSLCEGERFADQIAAASCSGVLVAPDVVATASHCLGIATNGQPDCRNAMYVIGYGLDAPDAGIEIERTSVFECQSVLAQLHAESGSSCHLDLALVRIQRTAEASATSYDVRERPVAAGEGLVVIGYPAGLPVKVDVGAQVRSVPSDRHDFFELDSDTFALSSGSGVFDRQGALVGVFARGYSDYRADEDAGCQRVHQVEPSDAVGFEQATPVFALRRLMAAIAANTVDQELASIARDTCGSAFVQPDAAEPPAMLPSVDAGGVQTLLDGGADGGAPDAESSGGCAIDDQMPPSSALSLVACCLYLLRRRRRSRVTSSVRAGNARTLV